ncbi:MAG: YcgN family cysteine cluster protein [Rhodospirillales bacterium]
MSDAPFWKTKTFKDMTRTEWESLCDGCAKCCLSKLQDEDTGEYHFTNVACRLLDLNTCRCTHYAARHAIVPECKALTPDNIGALDWLPSTCAYRLVYEGKDLADWHPLVSGDPQSVHRAGASVRGRVTSESETADLEDHIVSWPA